MSAPDAGTATLPELIAAIEHVHRGDSMLSPAIVGRLIALLKDETAAASRGVDASARLATLTQSERDVALAVGRGLTNASIAAELHMSVATIKAYVLRVLAKLQLEHRVQIALLTQAAGG